MSKTAFLIFPHQLFAETSPAEKADEVYLIEEYLFFRQYHFHKQKLAFHRASMQYYHRYLQAKGLRVNYIPSDHQLSDIRLFATEIARHKFDEIQFYDPTDQWLEKRIRKAATSCRLIMHENPQFINSRKDLAEFFKPDKSFYFQTAFYKQQRKKLNILMDEHGQPTGGKWTFDEENRKKYPKGKTPPALHFPAHSEFWSEAVDYTEDYFADNPGQLSVNRIYPVTHQEASDWLDQFLQHRFAEFGDYEDALSRTAFLLHHSLLSPLLNSGLLLPQQVIHQTLNFAQENHIPLNSTEGLIRQLIGWREFVRGIYHSKGHVARTRNNWKFHRKIPQSFYTGKTGIVPLDETIKKVQQTAYAHHIERLMVLGNFMLLCEFDPDEVYRWFMELFIDAYDWVMVPNVYGMSQFADGGMFATKPYISGSNYLKKMGDFPKGKWEEIWDALFWRFIDKHRDFFVTNPRTFMMVRTYDRMPENKRLNLHEKAKEFIAHHLEK